MRDVPRGTVVGMAGAALLLSAIAAILGLGPAGWLIGLACAAMINVLLARGLRRAGIDRLRLPNRITLGRATLVAGVAALVADATLGPAHSSAVVALATVALVLDAVDGWVARHLNAVTALGARFDMEVDALLILVLSAFVARSLGPWVLAIGLARYAYLGAGRLLPWLRRAVPPRHWAKVVAAIQGATLTVVAAGVLPAALATATVCAAGLLLAESFGRQVWWLWSGSRVPKVVAVDATRLALAGTR